MKKLALLTIALIALTACKKDAKIENQTVTNGEITVSETFKKTTLEKGCYEFISNGNTIKMKITELNEKVTGELSISYVGKDASKGEFVGQLNSDKLIGTYTFQSEGMESSREIAFMVKDNQLIEGYGDLNKDGTKFKDVNNIKYTSAMPLSKVDCSKWGVECLFQNGRSFSQLQQTCLELTTLKTKLSPLKNGAIIKGDPAYILFDKDLKKVELFLPNNDEGTVLIKKNEGNWTNGQYTLVSWKGYMVQLNGSAVFGGQ